MKFYQIHTSGHAEIDTLKKVVKKLKPGKIIPIHTFHPDKYDGLFNRKIEQVSDGEVFVAQYMFMRPSFLIRNQKAVQSGFLYFVLSFYHLFKFFNVFFDLFIEFFKFSSLFYFI